MDFKNPLTTVDSVVFTYESGELQVLLVKRNLEPMAGMWALPGGIVDTDQDTDLRATTMRKLIEKTGVAPSYLDQLISVGNATRDPRGWSITVVYSALIAKEACRTPSDAVSSVKWTPVDQLPELAFDHAELIDTALERMKQRALYSITPGYALPEEFTLAELQKLHETLIGKPLQKRSFRRRIQQAGLLIDSGRKRKEGGRPATLYRLSEASRDYNFVRNLEE